MAKCISMASAFFICMAIYIIPDSKATVFFHFYTPAGNLSIDKLLVIIVFLATIFAVLVKKYDVPSDNRVFIVFAYLIWISFTSIISLLSINMFMMASYFFRLVMWFSVFFSIYIIQYNDRSFVQKVKIFIVLLGLINALLCIAQSISNDPLFLSEYILRERGFYFGGERISRAWGFQGEALSAATLTMVSLVFSIELIINKRAFFHKFIFSIIIATLMVALFATFSRGSIISLLIGFFIIVFTIEDKSSRYKNIFFSFVFLFVLFVLFVFGPLGDVIYDRFFQLSTDASFYARWEIITSLGEMIDRFGPIALLGLSPGTSLGIRQYFDVLDNQYVLLLLEDGVFGVLLFLLIAYTAISTCGDRFVNIALCCILVNAVTYEMLYYSTVSVLFWLLVAINFAFVIRK